MATTLDYRYSINGVLSADKTVMQNLEALTNASGTWLNFDVSTGKWALVINKPEVSTHSFTDDNILSAITVTGTGLTELYNAVRVEFPHVDLNDARDFVQDTIPLADRNANEPDNTLVIQYDIVNDPIQAELLGLQELKQSRVDKIIKFTTDYTGIDVRAGDVVDVTTAMYGYNEKLFRVIQAVETDADDGSILIDITAMEYDANVYSTDDLYRYERTNSTGIITPGALAVPGTPELTQFSNISQPYLKMESTITSTDATALVEGVEFWYSIDQTNYYLAGVDRPTNDRNYINGEVAEFDWISAPAGNIWIKARGYNSVTTGPFSNVGSLQYQPVQVPDAVPVEDPAGGENDWWNMAALAAALMALNSMIGGNTTQGTPFGDLLTSGNVVTGLTAGNNISITQSIPGHYTISSGAGGGGDGTWEGAHRFVSSTQPSSSNNGDVWFKIP